MRGILAKFGSIAPPPPLATFWAATQINLGNALETLGERESGTAHLEEAVAAYRAALQERTRDRVPLDWAMTQCNLGIALARLGERESGTGRLQEAVAAWEACLTVTTATWPPAWVQVVHSLIDKARAEEARRASPRVGCLAELMCQTRAGESGSWFGIAPNEIKALTTIRAKPGTATSKR